jgi:predicted nucleic acid-binding protein
VNVVSDSSPLIALAAINSLDLLRALYGSIHLIDAKGAGLIVAISPLLGKLVAAGFYCSPRLIAQALELAGE